MNRRLRVTGLGAVLSAALVSAALTSSPASAAGTAAPVEVRVAQAGAVTGEQLMAYVMAPKALARGRFQLLDGTGRVIRSGALGASAGGWNSTYTSVQPIALGAVRTPGTYRVRVTPTPGAVAVVSPAMPVGDASAVSDQLTRDGTAFLTVQRDGADVVPGRLDRQPSHLDDRSATVYEPPTFRGPGTDELAAPLVPVAGAAPRDVEGGWFDAGDYLKFTQTASYTLDSTLLALRDSASGHASLSAETAHGLQWLDEMWDGSTGTLYAQVGIGSGSDALGILGDHDIWRLPQADDAADPAPGSPTYFASYRPVFAANAPGQPISPNLAGRVAAAFALASQVERHSDPGAARADLARAAAVLAKAKTTDVGTLVTTYPRNYYPESSWADDMELGATETARAARLLGDPRASEWLDEAKHWAHRYLISQQHDSLNLYDTSALADAELATELTATHTGSALRPALVAALKGQLDTAVARAAHDPFGSAAIVSDFDNVSHELGLVSTAELYARLTGSHQYDEFAARQRDWVFGANAWGTSFVIGEGTTYPFCPQHQVANLAGSLTGGYRVVVGGVVNGPNGADEFSDLGLPAGGVTCPADGVDTFAPFDTAGATYLDDARSWPSVEPADDFTATGILAYALGR